MSAALVSMAMPTIDPKQMQKGAAGAAYWCGIGLAAMALAILCFLVSVLGVFLISLGNKAITSPESGWITGQCHVSGARWNGDINTNAPATCVLDVAYDLTVSNGTTFTLYGNLTWSNVKEEPCAVALLRQSATCAVLYPPAPAVFQDAAAVKEHKSSYDSEVSSNRKKKTAGIIVLLLSFVLWGIYFWYAYRFYQKNIKDGGAAARPSMPRTRPGQKGAPAAKGKAGAASKV